MNNRSRYLLSILALALLAGLGLTLKVRATADDLGNLPVAAENSRFGCKNCHILQQPTTNDHDLNPFGQDYLANGRVWNAALANLNSDGDGCTNGFELGDTDGDGVLDGNVVQESGNPGEPDDCGGSFLTDQSTWGALKALFQQ
jgi:hypothetical protein